MDAMAFIGFPVAEQYFAFDGHPTELFVRARPRPGQRRLQRCCPPPSTRPDPSDRRSPSPPTSCRPRSPPRAPTTACSSAWAPSPCSSAASASPTSWSYPSWNAAPRSACAAPWAPPAATSPSNSSPKPLLLSLLGGLAGTVIGAAATAIYALTQHGSLLIPPQALYGGSRRRPGHRRHRRPLPRNASRPSFTNRGAAHGMTALTLTPAGRRITAIPSVPAASADRKLTHIPRRPIQPLSRSNAASGQTR